MTVKKRPPKASSNITEEAQQAPASPEAVLLDEPFNLAAEAAALIPQAVERLFPTSATDAGVKYRDLYRIAAGKVWPKLKP